MAMMGFDTLKLSKQLAEAGMDARQAEVLAQSFADILAGQFATKQDLKNAFAEREKSWRPALPQLTGVLQPLMSVLLRLTGVLLI